VSFAVIRLRNGPRDRGAQTVAFTRRDRITVAGIRSNGSQDIRKELRRKPDRFGRKRARRSCARALTGVQEKSGREFLEEERPQ